MKKNQTNTKEKNKTKQNSGHRTFNYKVPPVTLSVKITPPQIKFGQKRTLSLPHNVYFEGKGSTDGCRYTKKSNVCHLLLLLLCSEMSEGNNVPTEKDSPSAWSITNVAITSKHKQSSPSNPDASPDPWFHEPHSCFCSHYTHVVS